MASMDHLDLIGTSLGGLDHLEEIHGIDGSAELLDLIGTSRGSLDYPEEIHWINGSDKELGRLAIELHLELHRVVWTTYKFTATTSIFASGE
ncbi:hypothetical protein DVH24_025529 [Malus domestica]|uniref:Uncharacterized protein n=1 Tax=Malus domestica TaxID=3750 RepID=A0A498HKH7_MALDO|nr:hypothetical protein DVH24_025529 [Malus domestica]